MSAAHHLSIGVMPLTDAAPLIIAKAKGFFEDENLDVTLIPEMSWATIRDKVMFRVFDAAMMLAPMPLAMSFGLGHRPRPTMAPLVLSLNGNGITVSRALIEEIRVVAPDNLAKRPITADGLAEVIEWRRKEGGALLRFGVVFPYSSHQAQLWKWLQTAGIDPGSEVELLVVPPAQMAVELEAGRLDGYCVGEPWNQLAVRAGVGQLLVTSYEIWPDCAEKVLGVAGHGGPDPETLQALLRALIRAGLWLDRRDHRLEAARILVEGGWVKAPIDIVGLSLMGIVADGLSAEPRDIPSMHVFSQGHANMPRLDQAELYAKAMVTSGQLPHLPDRDALASVFRSDFYRKAAASLGLTLPVSGQGGGDDENGGSSVSLNAQEVGNI